MSYTQTLQPDRGGTGLTGSGSDATKYLGSDGAGNWILGTPAGPIAANGSAILSGGAATISTAAVQANSLIFLTCKTPGGDIGVLYPANVVAGVSFDIQSSSVTDTSTVAWVIVTPGSSGSGSTNTSRYTIYSKTGNFNATDGTGSYYRLSTNSATVTMPASPGDGSIMKFKVVTATKTLTFAFNGSDTVNHADGTSNQTLVLDPASGVLELIAVSGGWDET